jgi:two-component system sensor kinase FixL
MTGLRFFQNLPWGCVVSRSADARRAGCFLGALLFVLTFRLGVWELETTTNALWVSDEMRELFQFGGAPVSYARFHERVHPEDRAMREAAMQRAIDSLGGYEIEYRWLLPDGTMRWIASRGRLLRDEPGKPRRLLGVSMDITERKQAQQLFQLATEASPSGTLLMDADGRVVLVNSRVEKLFGYQREELIGRRIEILLPEPMAPQYPSYRADFPAAPHARDMEAVREGMPSGAAST